MPTSPRARNRPPVTTLIFGALKACGVIEREGFYMATYDPKTGERNGTIDAHQVAEELIKRLGLCRRHGMTECAECEPDEDDEAC